MSKPDYKTFYTQLDIMHTENGGKVGLFSDEEQSAFHVRVLRLLDAIAGIGNAVIHDAGCGYGDWLKTFSCDKEKYFGTDSRQEVIEAAQKAHDGYKFYLHDLTEVPAPMSDITIAIGTAAFLTKNNAVKIFQNLEHSTKKALLITCWGSFDSVSGSTKKEGKLFYEWLKKRMEHGSPFSRSAMLTSDKHGEAIFVFFNE